MTQYTPKSYFYTDFSALVDADITDVSKISTDAYGPVKDFEETKYRVTSFVRGRGNVKVFATVNGQLAILKQAGTSDKVNLIIKNSSPYFSPLKIKYFIYRGINKSDLIDDNNNIIPVNNENPNQPEIIKRLWKTFKELNPGQTEFPASLIGYETPASVTNLDNLFCRNVDFCSNSGEHIGNFTEKLGLDIVLDYGDYILENQEVLFSLSLDYAKAKEWVFDTSDIRLTTDVKKKRYKEHIHQFLDVAAFWGSHITDGGEKNKNIGINLSDGTKKNDIAGITPILKKYQTGNKIYIYIQGENNRSFGYYDKPTEIRKIYGFNTSGEENKTNDWPILIKKISTASSNDVSFQFDYKIEDTKINQIERSVSTDIIATNSTDLSLYPTTERPQDIAGKTKAIKITFPINTDNISCANFAFFHCRTLQNFPVNNYFNYLWIPNIKSSIAINSSVDKMHWTTYDKNRNISLDDTIAESAIIQNKIIFDEGKNKKRITFMAIVKKNSGHNKELEQLNVDNNCSGYVSESTSLESYCINLFNDVNFSIYKGTFTDTDNGKTINSLCLFHNESIFKKNSYLLLGITEDEYKKFTIPPDHDNLFFHLEEITSFANENVRKFKIGIRYEDGFTGVISNTILYPSVEINVYSIDDLFFFSAEYVAGQKFYREFATARIEFRTFRYNKEISPTNKVNRYTGGFGYDWIRIGDHFSPGDVLVPNEQTYKDSLKGGYERIGKRSKDTLDIVNSQYESPAEAYKFLQREYFILPTTEKDQYYYIPYLTLFSKTFSDTRKPKTGTSTYDLPPYEATLQIVKQVLTDNITKLEIEADKSGTFTFNKTVLTDFIKSEQKQESKDWFFTITCKKDFTATKNIKIWAYTGAEKKLAGIIAVNPNDFSQRKELDVVCVKVQTDADKRLPYEQGIFDKGEINFLYKGLYQALVVPNLTEISAYLPLENDTHFQVGGQFVEFDSAENNYVIKSNALDNGAIHKALKSIFISKPLYSKYSNAFINFSLGLDFKKQAGSTGRVKGAVEEIGIRCSVLFKDRGIANITFAHEILHGLGLYHTHPEYLAPNNYADSNVAKITEPDKKYTFYHGFDTSLNSSFDKMKSTDNIMSYSSNENFYPRQALWQWQKKIVYRYLKK